MKSLTNQAVIQHKELSDCNNGKTKFTKTQKFFLVAKALKEFHQDIAIPYASCAKVLAVIALFITSLIVFSNLFVRALDIEAESNQQVVIDHEQYLKIKLHNDAPEEKGEK